MTKRNHIFFACETIYYKLLLYFVVVLICGCANSRGNKLVNVSTLPDNVAGESGKAAFSRYSIIRNSDSTYGFTVFVNSRPCLHIRRIPLDGAESGFVTSKDAEKVAEVFLKQIDKGIKGPVLTRRIVDSLGVDIMP